MIALVVFGGVASAASVNGPTDYSVAAAQRARFGLTSDSAAMAALIGSSRDVGSRAYGIPATQAELDALDLPGRGDVAVRAESILMPAAAALPGFAGLYQDQTRGGRIVIRFNSLTSTAKASLTSLAGGSSIEIVEGAPATSVQLEEALVTAWKAYPRIVGSGELNEVAVDATTSTLVLGVAADSVAVTEARLGALRAELGVPISVEVRARAVEQQVCTARNTCYGPMKSGARIRNNGAEVFDYCTMAFHVYWGTGYGFTTAGHCSYGTSGDNWYMEGWPAPSGGFIGPVVKTLYADLGKDFMIVRLNDSTQRSNQIYASTRTVQGMGNGIAGQAVCASLGKSNNGIPCGTIRSVNVSWVSDDSGFIIRGGDQDGIATQDGDSGSPIFALSSNNHAVAVGIHNTATGGFAKMAESVQAAGARIYP